MKKNRQQGFTLLEIMLVLGIVGGIMVMAINYGSRQVSQQRRDKTALQMQQILNAGLAYYTANGAWPLPGGTCSFTSTSTSNSATPSSLSTLKSAGYLPSAISSNAFGYAYNVTCDNVTGGVFYVITRLNSVATALIIAGELPVAYLSDQYGNPVTNGTYVTSQVTTPGQNLNNARSLNFAGAYHHGACVPVPVCPGYNPAATPPACNSGTNCMTPQIMVAPASVSGVSDSNSTNAYPIASFTAYALGPATSSNLMGCPAVVSPATTPTSTVTPCTWGSSGIPNGSQASPSGLYWRVCLQVVTSKGIVSTTNTGAGAAAWGQYVSMVAMTRCTPPNEPFGSDFTVFTQ